MAVPQRVTIRSYQVGFGDCFLLGFHYETSRRFVLVDFGTTSKPKGAKSDHMMRVARDIAATCGNDLHAVVATHRHRDHISGFETREDGNGTGDVVAALEPDLVLQPWTEDPDAQPDATRPTAVSQPGRAFVGMLRDMNLIAAAIVEEATRTLPASSRLRQQLTFLGETNLSNLSAVENLMKMGKENRYLHFGAASGLRLSGVTVRVLGPPTLEQTDTIRKQRKTDEDEFWHISALAAQRGMEGAPSPFARNLDLEGPTPKQVRWLVENLKTLRRRQMREIVRIIDKALNNTSLILLFEVGDQLLLFPGDAQIENWAYAMSKPEVMDLLKDVTVYKVGHHGSLNATPRTMWGAFEHKDSTEHAPDRLRTFISTKRGKHGSPARDTEVPREKLVNELKKMSDYHSTESVKASELFSEVTIDIGTAPSA